jgi:hypothetical protein
LDLDYPLKKKNDRIVPSHSCDERNIWLGSVECQKMSWMNTNVLNCWNHHYEVRVVYDVKNTRHTVKGKHIS